MIMNKLLHRGDVIRTNPFPDYWGIAVVLSECEETTEFEPMCHIALTPLVFRHEAKFGEINSESLNVLEIENWNFDPLGSNPHAHKVIGVYSRITKVPISVIGSIDPTLIYEGPLPFSPDYGLEVTWPLCGTPDKCLGSEAITSWLRKNDPKSLDDLFPDSDTAVPNIEPEEVPENELWIMIKIDGYFHSVDEILVEEELIDLVESAELGEFDGHSSGAHQFDLNFFDVDNFDMAKKEITKFLSKNYPKLIFEISESYETTFDKI